MAEIVLNVEVRERTGTGGARAARAEGKVPGILYGGDRDPVAIAVNQNEFKKALYTGKLLGHLVTLKYGKESQPVIAKDIQFHPVNDAPVHFDLYRVDEHQSIVIAVPVHFINQDAAPGFRRGGALEIVRHEVEIRVAADHIPEELTVDMTGMDLGATIRISDVPMPEGAEPAHADRDFMIASLKISSAALSESADAAADQAATEAAAAEAAEDEPAVEADEDAEGAAEAGEEPAAES